MPASMSRHTKEKRKKQHQKAEAAVKEDNVVFDVFSLFQNENLDTKPNMAKFLKSYVKCITGLQRSKPTLYPEFELDVYKYFIKFFDGHELIVDISQKDLSWKYAFCYQFETIELSQKELQLSDRFFTKLSDFGFLKPNLAS